MQYTLKDIAKITTGVTFRSRIKVSPLGNVSVIQMKDLGDDNIVHLDQAIKIEYINSKADQLANMGDIIFRSRGQTNTAAIVIEESLNTIIAAPLFRIRPDTTKVLPEYLLWWINQSTAQSYLNSRAKGTMVQMITKQVLEELKVALPAYGEQEKIVQIFRLATQEQALLDEIKCLKYSYTQSVLLKLATQPNNDGAIS